MEEYNPVKKLTFQKPFGSRRKGQPKSRCIDDTEADQNSGRQRVDKKGTTGTNEGVCRRRSRLEDH
jgi:hypothetical protein